MSQVLNILERLQSFTLLEVLKLILNLEDHGKIHSEDFSLYDENGQFRGEEQPVTLPRIHILRELCCSLASYIERKW